MVKNVKHVSDYTHGNDGSSSPVSQRQSSRNGDGVGLRPRKRRMSSRGRPSKSPESHRTSSRLQAKSNKLGPSDPPRLVLRLGPRTLPTLHPGNVIPRKKFGSVQQLLLYDEPLQDEDDHRFTSAEASREATLRTDVVKAGKPGGLLRITAEEEDAAEEPFLGHVQIDYLTKHIEDLQQRIVRESREHRAIAKRLAYAAATAARAKMPKTAEELEAELRNQTTEKLKCVLKQFKLHLEMASQRVMNIKRDAFYEREAAQGREQMKEWVDRSEDLLNARASRRWEMQHEEEESDMASGSAGSDADKVKFEEEDEGSDDSSSSTNEEDEVNGTESDDDLTAEQLHVKYAKVFAHRQNSEDRAESESELCKGSSAAAPGTDRDDGIEDGGEDKPNGLIQPDEELPELEEVDDALLDNEDLEESDTSGTSTESDESESLHSEGSEENFNTDDGGGLLGLLPDTDVEIIKAEQSSERDYQDERETDEYEDGATLLNGHRTPSPQVNCVQDASQRVRTNPPVVHTESSSFQQKDDDSKELHRDDKLSNETLKDESATSPSEEVRSASKLDYSHKGGVPEISIPRLIRGQLRPYQHAGFEWLAGMYENATNGILADEMGLGKTFQTITLLAHLATHHHIWGPHLIVVPTSVILNWEIEFKKFLPGFKVLSYYGTQAERQEKRKGWSDLDKWNVCITSYQLAISDQMVLKRRPWQYLVLDEAHNIKNYKSQRWQTLLSFRSQARLLLTGTPLQNNLAELWSLLFFLAPEQDAGGRTSFGDLNEFSKVFHRPVDQILEHGRGALDEEAMAIVSKLHQVLRPHLLRRLKADVETQMPKKYEHVTICRLSKRQRQLYDGYMGLTGTRESFASGNYMSIINCLMQLRKVCNHPDLFETRQIVTSFAMPKSAIAGYEIKELLVRRRLRDSEDWGSNLSASNLWQPNFSFFADVEARVLSAVQQFTQILDAATNQPRDDIIDDADVMSTLCSVGETMRHSQFDRISSLRERTSQQFSSTPSYTTSLLNRLSIRNRIQLHSATNSTSKPSADAFLNKSSTLQDMILGLNKRSQLYQPLIERFACTTPNVTAPHIAKYALTERGKNYIQDSIDPSKRDAFHEARVRLSIAFPDKSLIQYDCGKLQQLDKLLRNLQSGGHRAVIFTQMTKVLDILEQFMNLHGHRYLRLDGATKIEQRQIITERFNTDTRILAFICSSRSGGLGINLTGADTVIFYDLDWNPAMDKQCQDRCHRIGQTRDVHIYRFVSEGTIEANILRKSNQKRMLDDVVIQEGDFTTEYFNRLGVNDSNDDTDAAIDKVFGGGSGGGNGNGSRMLQQAEDKEDQDAAKEAQKEDLQADDADFGEKAGDREASRDSTPRTTTTATEKQSQIAPNAQESNVDLIEPATADRNELNPENMDRAAREQLLDIFASRPLSQDKPTFRDVDEDGNAAPASSDDYLIRLLDWELRDVVWLPPRTAKDKKKKKKGPEFGIIRR